MAAFEAFCAELKTNGAKLAEAMCAEIASDDSWSVKVVRGIARFAEQETLAGLSSALEEMIECDMPDEHGKTVPFEEVIFLACLKVILLGGARVSAPVSVHPVLGIVTGRDPEYSDAKAEMADHGLAIILPALAVLRTGALAPDTAETREESTGAYTTYAARGISPDTFAVIRFGAKSQIGVFFESSRLSADEMEAFVDSLPRGSAVFTSVEDFALIAEKNLGAGASKNAEHDGFLMPQFITSEMGAISACVSPPAGGIPTGAVVRIDPDRQPVKTILAALFRGTLSSLDLTDLRTAAMEALIVSEVQLARGEPLYETLRDILAWMKFWRLSDVSETQLSIMERMFPE